MTTRENPSDDHHTKLETKNEQNYFFEDARENILGFSSFANVCCEQIVEPSGHAIKRLGTKYTDDVLCTDMNGINEESQDGCANSVYQALFPLLYTRLRFLTIGTSW